MNTQISFTADSQLKQQAMKKAKEKGLSLKAVLILSMEAFSEGKINFGVTDRQNEEVAEMHFDSNSINKNAEKLARLLK